MELKRHKLLAELIPSLRSTFRRKVQVVKRGTFSSAAWREVGHIDFCPVV